MKWLKWTALTLAALLVVLTVFGAWLVNTPSGARWSAGVAQNVLGAKLDIGVVEGALSGPLHMQDLHYRDPAAGLDVHISELTLNLAMRQLWRSVVHVEDATLSGVRVVLGEPQQPPEPKEQKPFTLEPPVDLVVDSFSLADLRVRRADVALFEITRAIFVGHWTDEDLAVERLELDAPQGEVRFSGRVEQRNVYLGEGRGRFRWQVGEQTYAGRIQTAAQDAHATLIVNLIAPVAAEFNAAFEQTEQWPWRFNLEAPRFDPRDRLAPDSSLESLAASLQGEGTVKEGSVSGRLTINGEPLHLDPLRFTRTQDSLAIDTRARIGDGEGELQARGTIRFAEEAWVADVRSQWRDLVIPARWSGQVLHTRGDVTVRGNTEIFDVAGELALGPPDRIANIALELSGTPKTIELEQFDIVQDDGRLAATGRIDLKPSVAWTLAANSHGFDPGAFAVAWPGDLHFQLTSKGRLTPEGPTANLSLQDLKGELRGRSVSGSADLAITPALVAFGSMNLQSGKSTLRFEGEQGETMDAVATFNVASLNDWLPDSGGRLNGEFRLRGVWPDLSIAGEARGAELHAADMRAASLALRAEVDDLKDPRGAVQLELGKLTAAGFEFDSLRARASGTTADHEFAATVTGSPLAAELGVRGARTEQGWSGSLNTLVFHIAETARLALREPARITLAEGAFELSQACLADRNIELCASGATQPDGALEARYSLANVPLALGNALATSDLPLQLDGTLEGRGDIRRSAEGELFGEAFIRSPDGRISRRVGNADDAEEDAVEPQLLLAYRDLNLNAALSGPQANARVSARFAEQGVLEGEASVRGLGEAESPVAARLNAQLPDISPFGVFAPQLANLQGRIDADVRVAGTVQAPEITGQATATDLGVHLPMLGLQLREGRLQARPAAEGAFALSGEVASGQGRLEFAGAASPSGAIDMNIKGDRFLAADIPGARALITPDLRFQREGERLELTGKVTIPEAEVNLQKLPRGERAQAASSDVVVIDAKTRTDEVEETPLYANVTVVLGEDVELTGFGLQASVEGRVDVTEQPGEPTVGSGEVRVAGQYKAYGQDLTIQEGRLLFANTPLDNPRLNFEATRTVEQVTAGLRVRGTAQNPELTVFSDPPMAQANALSYLVAGKPLDEIGADDQEGDMMQTAARSLGTAAGGLLAKAVGRRLGVDKLAVQDEEAIGGAALTVGQYLSPRLYLSYGVGLFDPGEVVTLRYKLSQDIHVQAQTGPVDTRAGVEYRLER